MSFTFSEDEVWICPPREGLSCSNNGHFGTRGHLLLTNSAMPLFDSLIFVLIQHGPETSRILTFKW